MWEDMCYERRRAEACVADGSSKRVLFFYHELNFVNTAKPAIFAKSFGQNEHALEGRQGAGDQPLFAHHLALVLYFLV